MTEMKRFFYLALAAAAALSFASCNRVLEEALRQAGGCLRNWLKILR